MLRHVNRSAPALHINEIDVNDKYQFLKQIGKGSYGEVWLVVPLRPTSSSKASSKQYVLKRLDLRQSSHDTTQGDIEAAEREAKLLSTLKHPNIVAYTESFRSNDGFLNIVMAYCEGGDLYTKLKERKTNKQPLTEYQIVEWFVQICMAIQYMHEKSILHRDLKTQNIFLTKNEIVKVGDLGIARVLDSGNDLATTIIGTPYYMSPEIFSNKPYGQKSDIWALGCCVYEMTTLEHAFNAKDMNSLVLKIIRGQMPQTSKKYSEPLTAIIKSMLSKDPDARPTAKKILQNPFIKRHIVQLLEKTKIKCQNQSNVNSQVPVVVSPPPSNPQPIPASNNVKLPHSSPSSPSSKKTSSASHSANAILPSYPHPPLPPSQNRVPNQITSSSSSSSADASRSLPSADAMPSSDARARRRQRARQASKPLPTPTNEQQMDMKFFLRVSQNDTLQLRRRNQQINNHLKQHQPASSEDEHEAPPLPVVVVVPPKKLLRPNSATSSMESDQGKLSFDDEQVYSSELESNRNYARPQSNIQRSVDANANPRQRRRENRIQSSVEASSQISSSNGISRSTSQESISVEVEKKKEGEKDMNDFLFMLTATLKLAPASSSISTQSSDQDPNELTQSSNDSDRTLVDSEHSLRAYPEPVSQSWALSGDRTMETPAHQANRLAERCQKLKDDCLRDISPEKLRRVLRVMDQVTEAQIDAEMIKELGLALYEKLSAQIFVLKFYEQSLTSFL